MEKKIKQIDIIFENCEICTLTPSMIEMCVISHICEDIGINCFQYKKGEVHKNKCCERLMLSINQKGLKEYPSFGDYKDEKYNLEDRIKYNDITHIDILYEDNISDCISVPWQGKDNNEYVNILQNNLYYNNHKKEECLLVIIQKTPLTMGEIGEIYETY